MFQRVCQPPLPVKIDSSTTERSVKGGYKQMKMLKKLLAVVLTGAMALTLLTACGGNAVV